MPMSIHSDTLPFQKLPSFKIWQFGNIFFRFPNTNDLQKDPHWKYQNSLWSHYSLVLLGWQARSESTARTYPGVAESHANGRIYGHTEVTVGPLHVQGEVSGWTHGNGWTEQQKQKPAGEDCSFHVSFPKTSPLEGKQKKSEVRTDRKQKVWRLKCSFFPSRNLFYHLLRRLWGFASRRVMIRVGPSQVDNIYRIYAN